MLLAYRPRKSYKVPLTALGCGASSRGIPAGPACAVEFGREGPAGRSRWESENGGGARGKSLGRFT